MDMLRGKGRAFVNVLLAALMAMLYFTTATPIAQSVMGALYNSPVYRGHKKGVIAVECAVNWNAAAIPNLLATLKEKNIHITFVVSGAWAQQNPELLVQMVQEGHEIGTMGQNPMQDGSADVVAADIKESLQIINTVAGIRPKLYYSGVRRVANSTRAANKLGLTHVLCTVDLLSGRGDSADILSRALDKPFDGSILLIQPTAEAAKALPACIEGLQQQGFRIGTISETLGEQSQKEVRI